LRSRLEKVMEENTKATSLLQRAKSSETTEQRATLASESLSVLESLVTSTGESDLDVLGVEVKLLAARLAQKAASGNAAGGAGGSSDESGDKENDTESNKTEEAKKKPFDPYEILNVSKKADSAEVKRAHRRLALEYHPDKNSSPEAVQIFMDVQRAYEILIDPVLRRRYDSGLGAAEGSEKMQPMKFKVVEVDKVRGKAKVWWYDPNTGEEGYMEKDIDKESEEDEGSRRSTATRSLREHCCLPHPDDEPEGAGEEL